MTKGEESGNDSAGSDSEPSEDNLEEEEISKIVPIKIKKKIEAQKSIKSTKNNPPPIKI